MGSSALQRLLWSPPASTKTLLLKSNTSTNKQLDMFLSQNPIGLKVTGIQSFMPFDQAFTLKLDMFLTLLVLFKDSRFMGVEDLMFLA